MTVNDFLDHLERVKFVSADVLMLPLENVDSEGDSEESDNELDLPLADHLSAQIFERV